MMQSRTSASKRPELGKEIASLEVDEVLISAEWDRATRSMADGKKIVERVREPGALIKVRDWQWLNLTTPTG